MELRDSETKVNVLVVDDNESMREVLATILSMREHRCESAENGIEAMEKVMQDRFDAVITDADMPELDGIALTKELTQHFPNLPVMIMTGQPDDSLEETAIPAGAREVLKKPFEISELTVRLHRMLHVQESIGGKGFEEESGKKQ